MQPEERRKNRTGLATTAVATVALLLSLASLVVATLALADSRKTSTARVAPQPTAALPTATPPLPGSTSSTDEAAPDLDATANVEPGSTFTVAYQREHLRATTPGCGPGFTSGIDFDEPRADAGGGIDAAYESCNPGTISTDLQVAKVSSISASPHDCLEQIRTQPEVPPITPTIGLTLCFVTDKGTAAQEGVSQKIVFLTVDSLSSANDHGFLNFTVTAYDVP
jgi:hypothetical protein